PRLHDAVPSQPEGDQQADSDDKPEAQLTPQHGRSLEPGFSKRGAEAPENEESRVRGRCVHAARASPPIGSSARWAVDGMTSVWSERAGCNPAELALWRAVEPKPRWPY